MPPFPEPVVSAASMSEHCFDSFGDPGSSKTTPREVQESSGKKRVSFAPDNNDDNTVVAKKSRRKKRKIDDETEWVGDTMPMVPGLGEVAESAKSKRIRYAPNEAFLKKMNGHSIVSNKSKCSMNSFVDVSIVSVGTHGDRATQSLDHSVSQDWKCEDCNVELTYYRKEAQRVCKQCAKSTFYQEMTRGDIISQGYTPTTAYLYKRRNHFKTWLKRTQGKETTPIPSSVIDMLKDELKKQRITDMSKVDHFKIKSILKKLRLNKYYNHWVQITTIVTGKTPLQMTDKQEITLYQMFDRVQEPFERIVMGKKRQNMLSYSFLIHKFLQLRSWDKHIPYFPLLVSANKIQVQDHIWHKLCKVIGFQFIKSIM